jgi:transcriptional regulator with XRE-family HTH domain
LKRKDLAERAHLSYPYISEIENGLKEPSAKALRQVAEALELSVAELAALSERVADDGSNPAVIIEAVTTGRPKGGSHHGTADLASDLSITPGVVARTDLVEPEPIRDIAALPADAQVLIRSEVDRWLAEHLPDLIQRELQRLGDVQRPGRTDEA